VWEGSGNITALDVLRALSRSPGAAQALLAEIGKAAGADARLDAAIAALRTAVGAAAAANGAATAGTGGGAAQDQARGLAGLIAVTLQASLLTRHAPTAVSEAFCALRLGPAGQSPLAGPALPFGTAPAGRDRAAILDRFQPA
jgi:putative acyl-CoA dehydrogenase